MATNKSDQPKKNIDDDVVTRPTDAPQDPQAYNASVSDDIWISNQSTPPLSDEYYAQELARQASIGDDDVDVRNIIPDGAEPVEVKPTVQDQTKNINNSILAQLENVNANPVVKPSASKPTPLEQAPEAHKNDAPAVDASNGDKPKKKSKASEDDDVDKDELDEDLDEAIDHTLIAQLTSIASSKNTPEDSANIRRKYAAQAKAEVKEKGMSAGLGDDATSDLAQAQVQALQNQAQAQKALLASHTNKPSATNKTASTNSTQTSANSNKKGGSKTNPSSNNKNNAGKTASNTAPQHKAPKTNYKGKATGSTASAKAATTTPSAKNTNQTQTNNTNQANSNNPATTSNNQDQAPSQNQTQQQNQPQQQFQGGGGGSYGPAPQGQQLKNNAVGVLANSMGILRNVTAVGLGLTNYAGKFSTVAFTYAGNLGSSVVSQTKSYFNAPTTPPNSTTPAANNNAPLNYAQAGNTNTKGTIKNSTTSKTMTAFQAVRMGSAIHSASKLISNVAYTHAPNKKAPSAFVSTVSGQPTARTTNKTANNFSKGTTATKSTTFAPLSNSQSLGNLGVKDTTAYIPKASNLTTGATANTNSSPAPEQRKGLFKRIKADSPLHDLSKLEKASLNKVFNDNDRLTRNMNSLENDPNLTAKQRAKKQETLNKNFSKYLDNSEMAKELISKNKPKDGSESHLEATKMLDKLNASVDKKMDKADKKGYLKGDKKEDLQERMKKMIESTKAMLENLKKVLDSVASVAKRGRKPGG